MNVFHVDVPIFNMAVVCCVDCDSMEAERAFYTYQDSRVMIPIPGDCNGYVVPYEGDLFMWVENPFERVSDVFHELVHIAQGICDTKGMTHDCELIAYLCGWLKTSVGDVIFNHPAMPVIESTEEVADGV